MWGHFSFPDNPFKSWHILAPLTVAALAGVGMFCEAYFLFAIGNIHNVWKAEYPQCFVGTGTAGCMQIIVDSATYVEIGAVIMGMCLFGIFLQGQGRRWGSRGTAALMLVGVVIMVASSGRSLNGMFAMFLTGLALFGVGTGGEYPLSATSAAERAAVGEKKHLEGRGRLMVLTFAMQGWGNLINTAVIAILLAATGTGSCLVPKDSSKLMTSNCDESGLNLVWRLQYAIGLPIVLGMICYRFFFLKESEIWKQRQDELKNMEPCLIEKHKKNRHKVVFSAMYMPRLIGVSICWFLWDIAFYGNKLFAGTIIRATLGPAAEPTLAQIMNATLINSAVCLVGYYVAAFAVDRLGRTRMQGMGFFIVSILFLVCGFAYDILSQPTYIIGFQIIYYLSSFFSQFGPNATTWLTPCELFPTDIRTAAHATAATTGKFGALISALVFSLGNAGAPVSAQIIFLVSGFTCLTGFLVTVVLVPDTTHMHLQETDRQWEASLVDEKYTGAARKYKNMSYFECWWFGVKQGDDTSTKPARKGDIQAGNIQDGNIQEAANHGTG